MYLQIKEEQLREEILYSPSYPVIQTPLIIYLWKLFKIKNTHTLFYLRTN